MEGLTAPFKALEKGLTDLGNFFLDLLNYINPLSEKFILKDFFKWVSDLVSWINPFSDKFIFKDFFSNFGNFLTSFLDWFNPFSENFFVYRLIELLGDLLKWLFVPSEESVSNLANSVKDKFRFVETINDTVVVIQDMFNGNTSLPIIKITLPNNKWFNGQVVVMDLNWYAPYKQYGDIIISAFIYIFFIWRIYISLSSIISGTGGTINDLPQEVGDIEAYGRFGFGRRSSLRRRQ